MKTYNLFPIVFLAMSALTPLNSAAQGLSTGSAASAPATIDRFTANAEFLKKKFLTEGSTPADLQKLFDELKKVSTAAGNVTTTFDVFAAGLLAQRYKAVVSDNKYHSDKQADADYYYTKCEEFKKDTKNQEKSKSYCDEADKALKYFIKMRVAADGAPGFTYNPQIVPVPTFDLKTTQLKIDGKTYDFKTGAEVAPVVVAASPGASAAAGAAVVATVAAAATKDGDKTKDAKGTKDVVADIKPVDEVLNYTCEWKKNLQRKILRGESCTEAGKRICSGHVNCTKNDKDKRAFTRLATCSESLCGDTQASECSKQAKFGSRNPEEEDSAFTDAKATPKAKAAGAAK